MKDQEKKVSQEKENQGQMKQITKKPWFWPAVYLSVCAVLLSSFFIFQGGGTDLADDEGEPAEEESIFDFGNDANDEEAMPVGVEEEHMQLPVFDESVVEVVGHFYDHNATAEEQEAALVYYNQTYYQNKGIDLANPDGESFDVTAALSGEVIKAEQDPLLGHVVEISHGSDLVTAYHSLEGLQVEEGDTVTKGTIIGSAGENEYNQDAGVHAHFEVRQSGVAYNPMEALDLRMADMSFDDSEGIQEGTTPADETDTPSDEEGEDEADEREDEDAPVEDESTDEDDSDDEDTEE
ncbi:M23 family metallopeptidase [Geomicrobium sediminis]|uniref:Stage II sporulation protein Q n=1 Tax=Geomicrobium sediminis TaxID=1347788 RepID=A0ABS2P7X9_9BACL|nr:M23 family metallopeptidase [Geomicrobium sediminis]MBM7631422.1 stage II sporulation protein Q [Geomicrobium sediminis]